MKKHNLFKVLGILLCLVIIVSYFLAGRSGEMSYIGILDTGMKYFQTVYYFFYVMIFLLAVGAFYQVLNKTTAYKKLLDNIVSKVKPLGKKFIFVTIIMIAIIASFTGLTFQLVLFVPFIVAIILLLGFDKLVALTTTIGSIMVGYIGGIFIAFTNPNTGVVNTFETFVGLENLFDNVFPKLLLLFAGIAILITFVNTYIVAVEKKKVKYELSNNDDVIVSEVGADYKDIKTWPIVSVFLGLFGLMVLGMMPFEALFGFKFFNEFHTVITRLTMGDLIIRLGIALVIFGLVLLVKFIVVKIRKKKFKFKVLLPIFIALVCLVVLEVLNTLNVCNLYSLEFMKEIDKFLSGNGFLDFVFLPNVISSDYLNAFGTWNNNGDSLGYLIMISLIIVATVVVAIVNKVKFNDMIDEVLVGVKKMIPTVLLIGLAYTVLINSYMHGFVENLITEYGKFNYGVSTLLAFLGSLVTVDFYYIIIGVFSPIVNLITDESIYGSVAIILQSVYGIFSLVGPTSLILVFALSYFDVPYTTWLKYIWRLVLGLIIMVALVSMLVVLL